jgi:hypothetical protein
VSGRREDEEEERWIDERNKNYVFYLLFLLLSGFKICQTSFATEIFIFYKLTG